jgi:hypothetical protein
MEWAPSELTAYTADPTVDHDLFGRPRISWAGQHHTLTSDEVLKHQTSAYPKRELFAIASERFEGFAEWHHATRQFYD